MKTRAYNLLKTWCDTLLDYRVSSHDKHIDGTLLCPACHVSHGRIADLTFPLALLYSTTGERRYLDALEGFIDWSNYSLLRPDGSWRNDAGNEWKGTSAFAAISIGDALMNFSDALPEDLKAKMMQTFIRLSDYVCDTFVYTVKPVINYYVGAACNAAMAWIITGNEKYLARARERELICRKHFDKDGLLFGEMKPIDMLTEGGCRPIDLGYNLEESMPLLIKYAKLMGEGEDFYTARFRDHMEFLLPDGAIDDSFGTRHNKWTYWGSRTSDGIIEGLALMLDDPMMADACERVLTLYEKCTHKGLMALPMASRVDEPVCLHHTFCHAKALAALVLHATDEAPKRTLLPTEKNYGIRLFQNGHLALVSRTPWRATVSAIDILYSEGSENGGGSMTLLMKNGMPICAATMKTYIPPEPLNMQYQRYSDECKCMTPRIVFDNGEDNLSKYKDGSLEVISDSTVSARGDGFEIVYAFTDKLTLTIRTDRAAELIFPVIRRENVTLTENKITIGDITISGDGISCNPSIFALTVR